MLDDARHGAGVEVAQPGPRDLAGEKPRVVSDAPLVPDDLRVELGLHAEELADVLVETVGELVQWRRADEHDLDVQLDRLRGQGCGRDEGVLVARVFEADAAGTQGFLELEPDQG